jgi:hypothetical protein
MNAPRRDGRSLLSRRRRDRQPRPPTHRRPATTLGLPSTPPRTTFRDLRAKGLDPIEAGNLTAYVNGLQPVGTSWTVAEIDRLMFLRYLIELGRLPS